MHLIVLVVGLYVFIVLLRFLLQLTRADYYNPVSQLVVKATNLPLTVLRRFIPRLGSFDLPTLILLIVLQMLHIALTATALNKDPVWLGLLILTPAKLLSTAIWIFVFALLIRAITSWFRGRAYHPLVALVFTFTEPLLSPARRLMPATPGLDLSPIAVFMFLMLTMNIVVHPLVNFGCSFIDICR